MRFHPKNLRLEESGLSKVLGFLEAEIMDVVWGKDLATVRETREALKKKKAYSFNTIMTVMNRLVEKKLLDKKEVGGSFAYSAAVKRETFTHDVTKSVVSAIVRDGALFQMAAFVEAIRECSEEDLASLRRMIDGSR
jgi:predicted transcriptional regulator